MNVEGSGEKVLERRKVRQYLSMDLPIMDWENNWNQTKPSKEIKMQYKHFVFQSFQNFLLMSIYYSPLQIYEFYKLNPINNRDLLLFRN